MEMPFSQACENNKGPILEQLLVHFSRCRQVLEIGSGTGQHAVHFAAALPHVQWQTSDLPVNHPGINAWISEYPSDNLHPPLAFTLGEDHWPLVTADGVFTANTTHIMQPHEARMMMQEVAEFLPQHGVFCQYGPFNIDGQYTSDSNREFDLYLSEQGYGGIRDIDELRRWVNGGLHLSEIISLPANNKLLVWHKATAKE